MNPAEHNAAQLARTMRFETMVDIREVIDDFESRCPPEEWTLATYTLSSSSSTLSGERLLLREHFDVATEVSISRYVLLLAIMMQCGTLLCNIISFYPACPSPTRNSCANRDVPRSLISCDSFRLRARRGRSRAKTFAGGKLGSLPAPGNSLAVPARKDRSALSYLARASPAKTAPEKF